MKDIVNLVESARNSISDYCMNVCHAKCCQFGFLSMNHSQAILILGKFEKEYLKNNLLIKKEGDKYHLNLGAKPCLKLDDKFLCKIHLNENRPRLCKDYPLFIVGKYVISASSCPVIEKNLLDEEFKVMESLGYKII
ncbi:MAG: YkgJ family cysteine cluster protein [Candidatus Woesearchaeota archaeon]|nr:YkgJ family cysteine cluster protein [Candidatus Woesearchaeota archaeon]